MAAFLLIGLLVPAEPAWAEQAGKQPNILIIWGDDIGWYNLSAYNMGEMGYRTPNIDRIAKEGALFTDWLGSFKEFPPRQKPASFSLDEVMQKLTETAGSTQ